MMFCDAERIIAEIRAAEARTQFRLAAIGRHLGMLQYEVGKMTQATDSLQAAVERETEVEKSAVTLIQGLADQVRQTSTDPQVQALADRINANAGALASAVAANTPTVQPTSNSDPALTSNTDPAAAVAPSDTGGL